MKISSDTATQAKLPGTGPTSTVARQNLAAATEGVRETDACAAGLRDSLKSARAEEEAASAELTSIERGLLAAEVDSREWQALERDHGKSWARACVACLGIDNLKPTLAKAERDHVAALAHLRAAREDLESVRQGRRRR